jgi:hypothetical protein
MGVVEGNGEDFLSWSGCERKSGKRGANSEAAGILIIIIGSTYPAVESIPSLVRGSNSTSAVNRSGRLPQERLQRVRTHLPGLAQAAQLNCS